MHEIIVIPFGVLGFLFSIALYEPEAVLFTMSNIFRSAKFGISPQIIPIAITSVMYFINKKTAKNMSIFIGIGIIICFMYIYLGVHIS